MNTKQKKEEEDLVGIDSIIKFVGAVATEIIKWRISANFPMKRKNGIWVAHSEKVKSWMEHEGKELLPKYPYVESIGRERRLVKW